MDPIADMLTRIRNAQAVDKDEVLIPYSSMKFQIAKILEKKELVGEVDKVGRKKKSVRISLKYEEDGTPHIRGLKRVSKQGQRIYKRAGDLRAVRGGFGTGIISTSQGLVTIDEARKRGVGGEVICEIW